MVQSEYTDEVAEQRCGYSGKVHGDDLQDGRAECFEGVDSFNYLGRVLHQTENDWPEVLRNIRRARQVWGRLGKLLRREGAELIISAKFYRAVVQAVLPFGEKTWVMLAVMLSKIEGVHVGFLQQVTGMKA